jgi:hypothetical protein
VRRAITRAAVDEDDLDVADPLLGGEELQATDDTGLLVARG